MVNFDKSRFCLEQVTWVGRLISAGCTRPEAASINTIQHLSAPQNRQQLQTLLGHVTYVLQYIPNLLNLTACFTDLLQKLTRFKWTLEHQLNFEKIKKILMGDLSLAHFDPKLDSKITVDASQRAAGFTFQQLHGDHWRSVEYRSYKFSGSQVLWSTNDKELYGLMMAVETFKHYLVKNYRGN